MKQNLILIHPQPPVACTDCSILDGSAHFYEKHDGKWDGKGAYCERAIPKCLHVVQAVKIGNAWLWAVLKTADRNLRGVRHVKSVANALVRPFGAFQIACIATQAYAGYRSGLGFKSSRRWR